MNFNLIGKVQLSEDIQTIHIDEKYGELLEGIEEFSHLYLLCYLNKAHFKSAKIHPQKNEKLPLVGVFSTRTPHRPNPISLTIVKLIKKEENTLFVEGLDVFDKTPVLDIKPYIPKRDNLPEATCPKWVLKLR